MAESTLIDMVEVTIHKAKTHLSKLLARVATGEEVIITKAGKPMARLVRFDSSAPRPLGLDRGKFVVPDDFDAPDRDIEKMFDPE